jgi:hypothetical protein
MTTKNKAHMYTVSSQLLLMGWFQNLNARPEAERENHYTQKIRKRDQTLGYHTWSRQVYIVALLLILQG